MRFISNDAITRAYANAQIGSLLRELLAIAYCRLGVKDGVVLRVLPKGFWVRVLENRIQFYSAHDDPEELSACEFHEHGDSMAVKVCEVRVQMERGMQRCWKEVEVGK